MLQMSYRVGDPPAGGPMGVRSDMRNALEEAMTREPHSIQLRQQKVSRWCILKAAAQGQISQNELVAAAADQIQVAITLFT